MGYIAIVDYGVGNLKSVSNAFSYLGVDTKITGEERELELADAIILPGVGAFPDAVDKLRASGLSQTVLEQGESKPVLGICLGMQLLLDRGEEGRPCAGLGVVRGVCDKIPTKQKLPHIGWNSLTFHGDKALFQGLDDGVYVYFVHSYCAQQTDHRQVIATTDYDAPVTAAVRSGNFFGCQFHPEKSGETGLTILRNFAQLNR
jgi:glutamine amidotransferase